MLITMFVVQLTGFILRAHFRFCVNVVGHVCCVIFACYLGLSLRNMDVFSLEDDDCH